MRGNIPLNWGMFCCEVSRGTSVVVQPEKEADALRL
jgi:hypothetical protein